MHNNIEINLVTYYVAESITSSVKKNNVGYGSEYEKKCSENLAKAIQTCTISYQW